MTRTILKCLALRWGLALLLVLPVCARADVAIVVNPSSPLSSITVGEVADLFLAKADRSSMGLKLIPIDQMEGGSARRDFYDRVVRKSQSQLNSYWSRLIFTGKARPPFAVADDAEVLELVAMNPSMLGYVDAAAVNDRVKVVLVVK
jgi:hypothetical protein